MILKKIELKNFRIHKETHLDFSENINYIVGGNGQGKTSILEAIYFLCTTKDFYSSPEQEIVNFNNSFFEVNGLFKGITDSSVRIVYSREDNKKSVFLNSKQVYKSAELIGKYPVVILTPSDHFITQGSPAHRRKFIDSVISQSSGTYLQLLLEYTRTLRQRSSLLSQYKETGRHNILPELDAWNTRLVQTGSEIIRHRITFLKDFESFFLDTFHRIMNEVEKPSIEYNFLDDINRTEEKIEERFTEILQEKRNEEFKRGMNLAGPHRDDFIFKINGNDLKKYGSQGQHKTFQVVLRFAQYFYLKEKLNNDPVFLMDDVFGELDIERSAKISSYLREIGQAFITLTDFSNFSYLEKSDKDLQIEVQNGMAAYAGF